MSPRKKEQVKKGWIPIAIGTLGATSAGTLGFEINQAISANNTNRDVERLERADMDTSKEIINLQTKISKMENRINSLLAEITSLKNDTSKISSILSSITFIKNEIIDIKGDIKILQLG